MPKGDPALIEKWARRQREWYRLAGSSADPVCAATCRSLAKQAGMMAEFWRST